MESSKRSNSLYFRVYSNGNSRPENGYDLFGLCKRIGKNCLKNYKDFLEFRAS